MAGPACRILVAPLGFSPTLDYATSMYTAVSRPIFQMLLDEAVANGTPWDVELQMLTAAGRPIWTRSVGEVETEDGGPVALAGALQDISARKAAETEPLAAWELTRDFYANAPCGCCSLGPDRTILRINDRLLSWLGLARARALGRAKPTDFMTPDCLPRANEAFAVLIPDGEFRDLHRELLPVDGRIRHVSISAKAIHEEAGMFVQTRSVMDDITELHSTRLKLALRAAGQHAMLDRESGGMLRVRAGLIVWTSRGRDRNFGCERADWDQMPISRLFDNDGCHRAATARIEALPYGDGTFREDQHLLRKDGSHVWVDVSTNKISPTAAESFTIVKDISDRKKAGAARLRTVELEAQNLALLETGRLRDEFLANMSHELRTPLNAVIGFWRILQVAKLGTESAKYANCLRQIGESGQHLLQPVQTMLDFGRTASGKKSYSPEVVSVQASLDEVAAMLEPKRLAVNVEIVVKEWCVEVEDHGIGIGIGVGEEGMKCLFGRFVRPSAGSTKVYGGTGLGLSLARMVARAQGGDVDVRSEPGIGSTFAHVLPRLLSAPMPQDSLGVEGA